MNCGIAARKIIVIHKFIFIMNFYANSIGGPQRTIPQKLMSNLIKKAEQEVKVLISGTSWPLYESKS